MPPTAFMTIVAAVVGAAMAGACAHEVTVHSNVPSAEVRVDGVRLGTVGTNGVTFTERGGFNQTYDIEVSAAGHVMKRRRFQPTETDPWLGIPAMGMVVGSCAAASCLAPLAGLGYLVAAPSETDVQLSAAIVGLSSVALVAGSTAIAAWGVERMPDVITIELDDDAAGAAADNDVMGF